MLPSSLLRQAMLVTGMVFYTVTDGFIFGQMSGMIEDLMSADSDIPLTADDVSWISATMNITCICGYILATVLSDVFGRPRVVVLLTAPLLAVWGMLYFARTFAVFMLSRILVGTCFGGSIFLTTIITAEYTPPNLRGVCMYIVTAGGNSVGTMLGHILSLFFHWRTVALFGLIPTVVSVTLPIFWVESPSWLASKGRFKDCEVAFKALHGGRKDADKELELLIEIEKNKLSTQGSSDAIFSLKKLKTAGRQTYFWKVLLIGNIISVYRIFASKALFATFAITMLKEITQSQDIFLFTLLVDGFAVFGSFLSVLFISRMKSRTLLFSTGTVANILLVIFSAGLYYKNYNNVYLNWANCAILALYFITVNAGPYPVLEAMYGELFPMEVKGETAIIIGTFASISHFLHIKFAPVMFDTMKYHGTFLFNAFVTAACLIFLWIKLPETKGRSLQEIELFVKTNTFDKPKDMSNGQGDVLI